MAKGFGAQPEKQLGYVLMLMPQADAYAAKFSLDYLGEGGTFIGITNLLEDAQVWKSIPQAKKALVKHYSDFLIEQQQSGEEPRVHLKRLKRSKSGKLTTELVETLGLLPEDV